MHGPHVRSLFARHVVAGVFLLVARGAGAQCADPIPPSSDWTDAIALPYGMRQDPGMSWAKFLVRTCEPDVVAFQRATYDFHAEFATAIVPPFVGMTAAEFEAVSLHAAGQEAILGVVLAEPIMTEADTPEIGIQLVRSDPYTASEVISLFGLVTSRVTGYARAYYMPTYEQRAQAEADRAVLSAAGIEISSPERWARADACYARGWALGRLVHVPTAEIDAAWLSGALLPTDVLLTDDVPSELPPVAGIACLEPSAPSSHVAILAETWGVPFGYLALPSTRARAASLLGTRVILRVSELDGRCEVRLIQVEGRIDEAAIQELLALKVPQPIACEAIERLGAWSTDAASLGFDDMSHFGGKSSGFGLLRRTIPASSPVATAFSFDLWISFLDQVLPSGVTLREEIRRRLAPHAWPPDFASLAVALQGVRDLFKDPAATSFSPEQEAAILAALQDPAQGFDPLRNLRFRSSTNLEDGETFTGAGLYASFSGCLADDQDADALGPSLCDATEANERGVFRAIRKVFASFYDDNAYLERLRHGVVEDDVGMALLVHHSYPDDIELANGVATLRVAPGTRTQALLVTQEGAVSVSNPTDGSIPEEAEVTQWPTQASVEVRRRSNLVPVGGTVLAWWDDYLALFSLLQAVGAGYEAETSVTAYALDFEYKKLAPDGRLEVKQVRRLPPASSATTTPFLVNEPATYTTFQGEGAELWGSHRLKSVLTLETMSGWLTPEVLAGSIFLDARHEMADACRVRTREGLLAGFPGAWHEYDPVLEASTDGWVEPDFENPRTMRLVASGVPAALPRDMPIVVPSDLGRDYGPDAGRCLELRATHENPVLSGREWMQPTTTLEDVSLLCQSLEPDPRDVPSIVEADDGAGLALRTEYWWPPFHQADNFGFTSPLSRFVRTIITGLTTAPLVLTSPWSQTYLPGRHVQYEQFVFDPYLEPSLDAAQLAELEAAGMRSVYLMFDTWNGVPWEIRRHGEELWGADCRPCLGDDADGDFHCTRDAVPDCDDTAATAWAAPSELADLRFLDGATLSWRAIDDPGATAARYDVLRSTTPSGFLVGATCVESSGGDLVATDAERPGAGRVFFYLVRAVNACPSGLGDLGRDSLGRPRAAPACP